MTKTRTPFLSLGSSGTIGGVLTSQKRGAETLLRRKPTPSDPYSLPQAYQRWLYQDYCALWAALSDADKQVWTSAASRFNMPGMAYFLRDRLTNLPDIVGMWHLDAITGNTVRDFSKNANHGTVYGPTLAGGRIDRALSFDGIDDYVSCGNDPSVYSLNLLSYSLFVYSNTWQASSSLVVTWGQARLELEGTSGGLIFLLYNDLGGQWMRLLNASEYLIAGQWNHIAATWNGSDMLLYTNGAKTGRPPRTLAAPLKVTTWPLNIGSRYIMGGPALAYIDHVIVYNRVLTPSDVLRHSLRRYPA